MRARLLGFLGRWAVYGVLTAIAALPILLEQSIERASFEDRLGTFPVQVSLAHNGFTTLDTGLVGKLYWERTGVGGFGAAVRSTGPPEAGGTLTSYVAPDFVQANAAFIDDPGDVAKVYGSELRSQVLSLLLVTELVAGVGGGLVGAWLFSGASAHPRGRRLAIRVITSTVVVTSSAVLAAALFTRWDGNVEVGDRFDMPGVEELSFSSQQTREVAQQVQPFIEKNSARIAERSESYRETANASFAEQLDLHIDDLTPREGERVLLQEADSQGSQVGTKVRAELYPLLVEALGEDAVMLRVIAGDVTSNGTVAEKDYVKREVDALPDVPLVAVKGDHDSDDTVEQLRDDGAQAPDLEVLDVDGLAVTGAADPAFKALFGGLITNPSGVSETETGQRLREVVDEDAEGAVQVVLHQPRAAAAYLGITSLNDPSLDTTDPTVPTDDGIPDVPAGTVSIGHLHDVDGPWVIWNTDSDEVTWTVVSQLGTSGGVEENPTFNRFSTPFSVPLKDVTMQLAYLNPETGLQTGYARIVIGTDGEVSIEDRVDVGLPGGMPRVVPRVEPAAPSS
ncbi:hypothetical protein [Nocardioides sp.]|uniref:hypothetical protein n=1 Tax=Nocardioides sp. TaxID=35761 RepID=UPI003569FF9C